MSRTVRYFKLIYIVAGILLSNEKICETVDQIQIAPRFTKCKSVEVKDKLRPHETINVQQSVQISGKRSTLSNSWYQQFYVFQLLTRLKRRLRSHWKVFSIWTLINFIVECSTSQLCRTFIINSDCDVIYK